MRRFVTDVASGIRYFFKELNFVSCFFYSLNIYRNLLNFCESIQMALSKITFICNIVFFLYKSRRTKDGASILIWYNIIAI